jgi:hypothetical protein
MDHLVNEKRAALAAVIGEIDAYPRDVLGRTRELHPAEVRRYTPPHLLESEQLARIELAAALQQVGSVRSAACIRD